EGLEYEDNSAELIRLKNANDKLSKENAEKKRQYEALLSEDELKKQQEQESRQAMEEELATLRKEKSVAMHKAKFLALGYDENLADETAAAMVDGDSEKVFACQQRFLAARDKKMKEELMSGTPRPGASSGVVYKTKEEIMKIKDTDQRQAAIAANPNLFGLQI
ncbi:MAG: hypothetical protein IIZ23_02415, partial [Ruminococcus sp.]|nr:hypothetical protein [Ruminococcus sp.]